MNINEKVFEKYTPEIDENGMVKIVPLNQFEWKVIPINEGDNILLISQDDFVCLTQHFAQFNENLTEIIDFSSEDYKEFLKNKGHIANN